MAKSKLFAGRGLDVMQVSARCSQNVTQTLRRNNFAFQANIKPFEDYLRCLLSKPALRRSDILFTFLTSSEEFTTASASHHLGKMIKNVPMKLTKERGQGLQPFISHFFAATQPGPPKPR